MTNTPAPTTPYHVYAICAGSGPVVIGRYESEQEQRTAYALAKRRLHAGDYFSPDVRDIALGEDPEWRRNRQVTPVDIAMILGGATDTQTVAMEPEVVSGSGYKQGELVFAEG